MFDSYGCVSYMLQMFGVFVVEVVVIDVDGWIGYVQIVLKVWDFNDYVLFVVLFDNIVNYVLFVVVVDFQVMISDINFDNWVLEWVFVGLSDFMIIVSGNMMVVGIIVWFDFVLLCNGVYQF